MTCATEVIHRRRREAEHRPRSATTLGLPGVVFRPFDDIDSATVDLSCIYRKDDESAVLRAFLDSIRKFRDTQDDE